MDGKRNSFGLVETIMGAVGILGIILFVKILATQSKKRLLKILQDEQNEKNGQPLDKINDLKREKECKVWLKLKLIYTRPY